MCIKSQGVREDDHCVHAPAETSHQFMRGKVTANQTETQADQQIALSPALRAMCSSLDRTTDGQRRKYDHTSPAADPFFFKTSPISVPQQIYKKKKLLEDFPRAASSSLAQLFWEWRALQRGIFGVKKKKKSHTQFKLLLMGAALYLFVTPSWRITGEDWGRLQTCGCWETAVGGLWNAWGGEQRPVTQLGAYRVV